MIAQLGLICCMLLGFVCGFVCGFVVGFAMEKGGEL